MFTSTDPHPTQSEARSREAEAASSYAGPERRRRVAATFDPVYVSRFVWRWRWLAVATTAAGLGLGIMLASATPKTYLASTSILLDPRDLKVVQNEVAPNALPSDATLALIESQTAVATSDRVLSDVIAKGDLANDPEFNGERRTGVLSLLPPSVAKLMEPAKPVSPAEASVRVNEALRHALTVAREPKSFIITLSVKTENAAKSARLANLVGDSFMAEIGRIQSDTARRATVALSSRLSELQKTVGEAESRVEDYKTKNSLIGVNGKLVDDEYITRINDQLARARADITALRVKADSLREASVDDVVKGALPEELSSESLVRLRQNAADLAQQAASLAAKLGPRHPQRIAIESALGAARDSIRRELGRIVAAGQTELARAESTERDLTTQLDELKSKQILTSESFVKLRELEREVDASRAVYEAFLLRARETSEQESLNTANIHVISEATAPIRSNGPSRKLIAVAGAVAGFVLGLSLLAGIAMLRLAVGFLRLDRREAAAPRSGRAIWTEADRAAHRRAAAAPLPEAVPTIPPPQVVADVEPVDAPHEDAPAAVMTPPTVSIPPLPPGDARTALRERLRAIGVSADHAATRRPETELIEHELRSVRAAITEIRRRRLA
ncbi:GumC family protein [Aureimonas leprariae]|uniref:Succinoglycan biosynthesis protein exop n=1 Tax=Plantimonas leprariae TaxID=2615207 RepID=A0A7V7PQH9_9HYPH|nr:GumC family protein [Aureimonas leprariae]KAB0680389.1 succinoglycan biosynthesis protein exop [Aureimonas leprariae]